jgi:hypothetical protein
LETIKDAQAVLGLFIAGFTLISLIIGVIIKWIVVPNAKSYIDERTKQIQPDANGGKSLPDIAYLLGELKGQIDNLFHRIEVIEENTAIKRRKKQI